MLPHILCQHLIMCQQQDRMPHIMHLDEDISDTTSLLRIEIAARFIDEQKLWSMDESSGQTDELFLSFREMRDQDIRLMDESIEEGGFTCVWRSDESDFHNIFNLIVKGLDN